MSGLPTIGSARPAMTPDRADFELLHTIAVKENGMIMLQMGVLEPDELQQALLRAQRMDWVRLVDMLYAARPPKNEPELMRVFMLTPAGQTRLRAMMV